MNALCIRPTQALVAALIAFAGVAGTVGTTVIGYQQVAAQAAAPANVMVATAGQNRG
jgi:hypothetical protein